MMEILAVSVAVLSLLVNGVQYLWSRRTEEEIDYLQSKYSTLVDNYIEMRRKFVALKNSTLPKLKKVDKVLPKKKKVGRPTGSKNKK